MADLRYPLNATGGYDYKGRVTFQVGTVQDNAEEMGRWLGNQARLAVATTANPNLLDPRNETGTSISEAEKVAMFGLENAPRVSDPSTPNTSLGKCSLYLPQGVQFRDGAEFQNLELGAIGAAANRAVNNGQNIAAAVASASTNELGSMVSEFANGNTASAKLAGSKLAARYGGERIGGGIKSSLQVTANPNSRTLFRSVALRKFTFAFKLIATSEAEAREIKNIIKFFRVNMYPKDNIVAGISYTYTFPAPFIITMSYDNKRVATKILPSYLEDISISYNSTAGGAITSSGDFLETDVQLSFTETRALRQTEIRNEDY